MRAILKNVGEPAILFDGDISYEFMNSTVGGYVQMVPIGPEVEIVCNEEGMFAGPNGAPLPQNAAGFLGNIVIVAMDCDSGECRDMTDEELRRGFAYLAAFANVEHPGNDGSLHRIMVVEEAERFMRAKTQGTLALWDSL